MGAMTRVKPYRLVSLTGSEDAAEIVDIQEGDFGPGRLQSRIDEMLDSPGALACDRVVVTRPNRGA